MASQVKPTSDEPNPAAFAQQVAQVRDRVQVRLARLANAPAEAELQQVYLCRNDQLCGVRLTIGNCHARWILGRSTIQLFRDGRPIDEISFQPARRAA